MTDGYIYCFSNPSMPGILKVGMTERTPELRLSEANASDTWRPPTPYKIEFAKKVSNPSQKEKTLHTLLEQYTHRIHPRREFFKVSREEVRKFFDLMDGEMWAETREEEEEEKEEEEEEEDTSSESAPRVKATGVKATPPRRPVGGPHGSERAVYPDCPRCVRGDSWSPLLVTCSEMSDKQKPSEKQRALTSFFAPKGSFAAGCVARARALTRSPPYAQER